MKKYRLKIPLYYIGRRYDKGFILTYSEEKLQYELEYKGTYNIMDKFFVENNPDIFELIEEPQEEVIEGYAYTDDSKEYWIYKTGEPDGIRAVTPATLILNPKKRKEYVRYLTPLGLRELRKDSEAVTFFKTNDSDMLHKITITVEDSE